MLATLASISRLHIVAIATLGTFTFGWLFTGRYPWLAAGLTALDWFIVNLLNRVVDLPEDRINAIHGTDFVARNRRAIVVVGAALLVGSLALTLLLLPLWLTVLRAGYHLLGVAYNWGIGSGGRRIKQLYVFKNTASAAGFLLTVFGYPLALANAATGYPPGVSSATIVASAVFFFLFELSYEVIYDLRDAPGDARANVRTFPVVHGERGAMRIIDGLIIGSMAVLSGGYAAGIVPWRVFVMILAPAIQLVGYKRAVRRGGVSKAFCIGITWLGAGLLFAYHLWVVAGLPGVGVPR